jgi:carbonic anhydrase/acetyltransferase-like protein (isoleucine patch superfamily)
MDLYDLEVVNDGPIFVAPNATIVGEVYMGVNIAIWHGTVIRGDINRITYFKHHSVLTAISVSATTAFFIPLPPLLQDLVPN